MLQEYLRIDQAHLLIRNEVNIALGEHKTAVTDSIAEMQKTSEQFRTEMAQKQEQLDELVKQKLVNFE